MQQTELPWHDSIFDAVRGAVAAAGGTGTVAKKLWPAMAEESRTAKLRTSLSEDHAQKLDLDEFLMIAELARSAGDLSIVNFLSRRLDFEFKAISSADAKKRARRARRVALLEELKRLEDDE